MVVATPTADSVRISVIIPVFNDQDAVHVCLEALKSQSYPAHRMQVLLVDNGSEPPLEISGQYPFELRIVRCATPGAYAARNAGARVATGEFFAFTDADCTPERDWLEHGVRAMVAAGECYVLGGDARITEPEVRTGAALYQYFTGFQLRENIEHKGFAGTGNLFCSRGQFQRIGPFEERLFSGGDREWGWRARKIGIDTRYSPHIVVTTPPRATLSSAIRQARRVAAGRYYLRTLGLDWAGGDALQPLRSSSATAMWILRSGLPFHERAKVLFAAAVIKLVSILERVRLRLGGTAERR